MMTKVTWLVLFFFAAASALPARQRRSDSKVQTSTEVIDIRSTITPSPEHPVRGESHYHYESSRTVVTNPAEKQKRSADDDKPFVSADSNLEERLSDESSEPRTSVVHIEKDLVPSLEDPVSGKYVYHEERSQQVLPFIPERKKRSILLRKVRSPEDDDSTNQANDDDESSNRENLDDSGYQEQGNDGKKPKEEGQEGGEEDQKPKKQKGDQDQEPKKEDQDQKPKKEGQDQKPKKQDQDQKPKKEEQDQRPGRRPPQRQPQQSGRPKNGGRDGGKEDEDWTEDGQKDKPKKEKPEKEDEDQEDKKPKQDKQKRPKEDEDQEDKKPKQDKQKKPKEDEDQEDDKPKQDKQKKPKEDECDFYIYIVQIPQNLQRPITAPPPTISPQRPMMQFQVPRLPPPPLRPQQGASPPYQQPNRWNIFQNPWLSGSYNRPWGSVPWR